jgi:hypothetical protein
MLSIPLRNCRLRKTYLEQTSSGVIRFLYALFLFPDVSQRVFEEIQTVTQGIRLPHFNDRSQLLYTEAVWKEAARWRTFFPIGKLVSFGLSVYRPSCFYYQGLPHVSTQDEVVRGYFVPKGTIIHQNTMSVSSVIYSLSHILTRGI